MKITSLVENTTADPRLGKEHGLSLYIEAAGKTLLFDMGQSGLFAQNARTLGLDLAKVDLAVLSHGHYDHGGGLTHFLELNKTAPVLSEPLRISATLPRCRTVYRLGPGSAGVRPAAFCGRPADDRPWADPVFLQ